MELVAVIIISVLGYAGLFVALAQQHGRWEGKVDAVTKVNNEQARTLERQRTALAALRAKLSEIAAARARDLGDRELGDWIDSMLADEDEDGDRGDAGAGVSGRGRSATGEAGGT